MPKVHEQQSGTFHQWCAANWLGISNKPASLGQGTQTTWIGEVDPEIYGSSQQKDLHEEVTPQRTTGAVPACIGKWTYQSAFPYTAESPCLTSTECKTRQNILHQECGSATYHNTQPRQSPQGWSYPYQDLPSSLRRYRCCRIQFETRYRTNRFH